MRRADTAKVDLVTGAVRAACIIVGSAVAIQRLAARIEPSRSTTSFTSSLRAALQPEDAVIEALGRSLVLIGPSLAVALVLGAIVARIGRRRPVQRDGRPAGFGSVLVLALAVPGLVWLPLADLAEDRGFLRSGPAVLDRASAGAVRLVVFWSLLVGLAVAPAIAASLGRARRWSRPGAGGHPALARLAGPPLFGRGPLIVPTAALGLALAVAETRASSGGLFDRFADELAAGRADLLLSLGLPVVLGGLLLSAATDLGGRLIDRGGPVPVMPPGPTDAAGPARRALVVTVLVIAVAVSALAEPITDPGGASLAMRTSQSVGPGLLAAVVPAGVAAAVGAGLAAFGRTGGAWARVLDTLVGLLWWPIALVVPLAAGVAAAAGSSLQDPIVLQVTGLVLVPPATGLLQARSGSRLALARRLLAATAVLAALALAAHLVAGLLIPAAPGRPASLGQLVADGSTPSAGVAALLVPIGASVLLLGALLALAAVAGSGRPEQRSITVAAPTHEEAGAAIGVEAETATATELEAETDSTDDLVIHLPLPQLDDPIDAATPDATASMVLREPEPPAEINDIRSEVTIPSAIDIPVDDPEFRSDRPLDLDREPLGGPDIDDEATRTIELRPSLFRHEPDQPAG